MRGRVLRESEKEREQKKIIKYMTDPATGSCHRKELHLDLAQIHGRAGLL